MYSFYKTETMTTNSNWQKSNFVHRHVFTRFACHGFYHLFCIDKKFIGMQKERASVNIVVKSVISSQAKKLSLQEAARSQTNESLEQ